MNIYIYIYIYIYIRHRAQDGTLECPRPCFLVSWCPLIRAGQDFRRAASRRIAPHPVGSHPILEEGGGGGLGGSTVAARADAFWISAAHCFCSGAGRVGPHSQIINFNFLKPGGLPGPLLAPPWGYSEGVLGGSGPLGFDLKNWTLF